MQYTLALDIGGTKTHCGLVSSTGRVVREVEIPTNARGGNSAILKGVLSAAECVVNRQTVSAIGISVAGHIDWENKQIVQAGPNFRPDFKNCRLVDALQDAFNAPAFIENDARCFALAEAVYGRGKPYARVVGIVLGTGIGGGFVGNKLLIRGAHGLAGEVGQMFTRGNKKTWEQIAAGGAFNKHGNLQKGAQLIAEGIHNIVTVLDPDVVVLGGGLSREPGLVRAVAAQTKKMSHYTALRTILILKSELLRAAPLLGAMLITR